jgi:hypothetical protein
MRTEKPYLSFIVTARNDNYGGNWTNRLNTYIRVLIYQTNRTKLPCELIFVDYNPLPHNKKLAEELTVENNTYLTVRFITASKEFHESLPNHEQAHLCEFIGKNIGARRAHGEWIVINNPDVMYANDLFDFLASRTLDPQTYYRIHRRDTSIDYFPPTMPVEKILGLVQKKIIRIMFNRQTLYYSLREWIHIVIHGRTWGTISRSPLFNMFKKVETGDDVIAENGAGDFLAVHRDAWEKVRGYEEVVVLTGVMDSYILYVLYCYGYAQKVLPYHLYHIYHNHKGVTYTVSREQFRADAQKMLETKIPYKINPTDWGFPQWQFEEIIK